MDFEANISSMFFT